MKNSKILIFILSIILLIVVIKCVRGVRPREGFVISLGLPEWKYTYDEQLDTDDERHLRHQIKTVGYALNDAIEQIQTTFRAQDLFVRAVLVGHTKLDNLAFLTRSDIEILLKEYIKKNEITHTHAHTHTDITIKFRVFFSPSRRLQQPQVKN